MFCYFCEIFKKKIISGNFTENFIVSTTNYLFCFVFLLFSLFEISSGLMRKFYFLFPTSYFFDFCFSPFSLLENSRGSEGGFMKNEVLKFLLAMLNIFCYFLIFALFAVDFEICQ
jgi:hypothetical protein